MNKQKATKQKSKTLSVSCPVKYTDSKGEELTSWKRCGVAWQYENGMSIKLDTLPLNGQLWVSEFHEKESE